MLSLNFFTTNQEKINKVKELLDGFCDLNAVSTQVEENGDSALENAMLKYNNAISLHNGLFLVDDYALHLKGVNFTDICSPQELQTSASIFDSLTFPGVFAHRVLSFFDPDFLYEKIVSTSTFQGATAEVVLILGQKNQTPFFVRKTTELQLSPFRNRKAKWFWNEFFMTEEGVHCSSEKWHSELSPRAQAIKDVVRFLSNPSLQTQ